jgi:hypothetical protein
VCVLDKAVGKDLQSEATCFIQLIGQHIALNSFEELSLLQVLLGLVDMIIGVELNTFEETIVDQPSLSQRAFEIFKELDAYLTLEVLLCPLAQQHGCLHQSLRVEDLADVVSEVEFVVADKSDDGPPEVAN